MPSHCHAPNRVGRATSVRSQNVYYVIRSLYATSIICSGISALRLPYDPHIDAHPTMRWKALVITPHFLMNSCSWMACPDVSTETYPLKTWCTVVETNDTRLHFRKGACIFQGGKQHLKGISITGTRKQFASNTDRQTQVVRVAAKHSWGIM